ncbi:DMT family transporter [Sphingomicrobium astaxanthinifaciens]|uniref:DMT family transporter n=1 Tax=Sphingomicrobium astaxanthinifaciens TaxID=1227949 RepID=UPI001FCC260A|nr:DMT family transporter [Sphingomicrobium astaxanthinifaciens]MCJ7421610.1 DMT family transporter [Sphingomicrobium astaxanthinifaciens]
MRWFLVGALAILAFAANSLLARAALADGTTGAGMFAGLRLLAGALVLLPFLDRGWLGRHVGGGAMLALYAILFAFAYVRLDAASGALILFAVVQATIVGVGAARGGKVGRLGSVGILLAFAGVALLLAPGARGVDPLGAAMMAAAGVGWGAYTLIGQQGGSAAGRNAESFLIAAIIALPLLLLDGAVSARGALLALLSGAVTSGLGYVAWYAVAPRLSLTGVAAVQLATPPATALLAWPLLGEMPGARLALASALVLGGIALAMRGPPARSARLAEPERGG